MYGHCTTSLQRDRASDSQTDGQTGRRAAGCADRQIDIKKYISRSFKLGHTSICNCVPVNQRLHPTVRRSISACLFHLTPETLICSRLRNQDHCGFSFSKNCQALIIHHYWVVNGVVFEIHFEDHAKRFRMHVGPSRLSVEVFYYYVI